MRTQTEKLLRLLDPARIDGPAKGTLLSRVKSAEGQAGNFVVIEHGLTWLNRPINGA